MQQANRSVVSRTLWFRFLQQQRDEGLIHEMQVVAGHISYLMNRGQDVFFGRTQL